MEGESLKAPRPLLLALVVPPLACASLLVRSHRTGGKRSNELLRSSSAAFWRGELGAAANLAREAIREAAATDNTHARARALFMLAGIHRWCAHQDSALTAANRGIALAHLIGDPCLEAEGRLLRCAAMFLGRDTVAGQLDSAETAVAHCGDALADAHLALLEARSSLRTGDVDEARNLLSNISVPALPRDLRVRIGNERLFLNAHLLGSEGKLTEAVAAAEEVLRMDRLADQRPAVADDLWLLARLHLDAGDAHAARNAAERALSVLGAMSPPEMTARRRETLSSWLKELETPAE